MSGRVFFAMARRLAAYQGVIRQRVITEADGDDSAPEMRAGSPRQPPAGQPAAAGRPERVEVPATQAALQATPEFAGIFSFGKGG